MKYSKQIRKALDLRNKKKYFTDEDFEAQLTVEERLLKDKKLRWWDWGKWEEFNSSKEQSVACLNKGLVMSDANLHFSSESRHFISQVIIELLKYYQLEVIIPKSRFNGGIHFMTVNKDCYVGSTLCVYQVWNDRKADIGKCRMLDYQISSIGATKGCIISTNGLGAGAIQMMDRNVHRMFWMDNEIITEKFRHFKNEIMIL